MNNESKFPELQITSINDGCDELGRVLGLNKPVTPEVLYGALSDDTYANNLLACREAPKFLEVLLNNPPTQTAKNTEHSEYEVGDLLARASKALFKWAKTGFLIAKEDVISKRLTGCMKCPNMTSLQCGNGMYKILKTNAICKLCGCDVEKKARINSERCPEEDPGHQGYNRWGQSMQ